LPQSVPLNLKEERCERKHTSLQACARPGAQPQLSAAQRQKATWLRMWAREAGAAQLSIDEAAHMVAADALPPDLAALWARKAAEQECVAALVAAAMRGDLPALQARAAPAPPAWVPQRVPRGAGADAWHVQGAACDRARRRRSPRRAARWRRARSTPRRAAARCRRRLARGGRTCWRRCWRPARPWTRPTATASPRCRRAAPAAPGLRALLSRSWSLSTFVRPPVCGWQACGVLRAAPRGLAPLHPDRAAAEPGALALLAALVTRARAPAASVQACHREGTHAAHRAGPTPGRCARAQVARRYEQCDAEGVLLRAGARDPEGDAPAAPAAGGRGRGRARGSGAPRRHPAAREARGVREAAAGAGDGARAEPGGAAPPPAVQASLAALGKDCSAAGAPPLVLPCPCMLLPLAVPCSTTIGCTVCLPLLQPAAAVGRAGKS
jgi:hypothetical protein